MAYINKIALAHDVEGPFIQVFDSDVFGEFYSVELFFKDTKKVQKGVFSAYLRKKPHELVGAIQTTIESNQEKVKLNFIRWVVAPGYSMLLDFENLGGDLKEVVVKYGKSR